MSESLKAVLALGGCVCLVAAALGWVDDRPDAATWAWRTAPVAVAAGLFGLLAWGCLRADPLPDRLAERFGPNYFNRRGFAFHLLVGTGDDPRTGEPVAVLRIPFQNQRTAPCRVTLGVRGGRGFWLGRGGLGAVEVEIDCPGGATGAASVPIAVPRELAGKSRRLEVGATVTRPEGRGGPARYGHGVTVSRDARFRNPLGCLTTGTLLLGGVLFYKGAATAEVTLPEGVRDDLPPGREPTVTIFPPAA